MRSHFIRTSAFLTAFFLLLCAVSCDDGRRSGATKIEPSLQNLATDKLDTQMTDFLIRFSDWYCVEEGEDLQYDCEKAGDGDTNILRCIIGNAPCVDWSVYPVSAPQDFYNNKKLDPKKWAKQSGGCYSVYDSADAEWIAINIFHATEKDIENMRAQGAENEWFYLHKDKYYVVTGGLGDPLTEYTFDSAKTDGKVYYIEYSSSFYNGETRDFIASYRAELEQKNIDGKAYWTLLRFEETSED